MYRNKNNKKFIPYAFDPGRQVMSCSLIGGESKSNSNVKTKSSHSIAAFKTFKLYDSQLDDDPNVEQHLIPVDSTDLVRASSRASSMFQKNKKKNRSCNIDSAKHPDIVEWRIKDKWLENSKNHSKYPVLLFNKRFTYKNIRLHIELDHVKFKIYIENVSWNDNEHHPVCYIIYPDGEHMYLLYSIYKFTGQGI